MAENSCCATCAYIVKSDAGYYCAGTGRLRIEKPDTTKCWEYKKKWAAPQVCRQKKELKNSAIKSINIDSSQDALRYYTTLDNGHISMVITGTVTMSFEDFIDCFEKVE
jgi:hypothetical protein